MNKGRLYVDGGRMRRMLIGTLVVLLCIIGVGVGAIWLFPTPLARMILRSTVDSHVGLDNVRVQPHQISLRELEIYGHAGKKEPPALTLGYGVVEASPWSLIWSDPLYIKQITLEDIGVFLDFSKGLSLAQSNWKGLVPSPSKKEKKKSASEVSREIVIEELVLQNLNVELLMPNGQHRKIPPKNWKFKNISSADAVTGQLSTLVMTEILREALSLGGVLSTVGDIGVGAADLVEKSAMVMGEGIEQAPEAIGSFFSGVFGSVDKQQEQGAQ